MAQRSESRVKISCTLPSEQAIIKQSFIRCSREAAPFPFPDEKHCIISQIHQNNEDLAGYNVFIFGKTIDL